MQLPGLGSNPRDIRPSTPPAGLTCCGLFDLARAMMPGECVCVCVCVCDIHVCVIACVFVVCLCACVLVSRASVAEPARPATPQARGWSSASARRARRPPPTRRTGSGGRTGSGLGGARSRQTIDPQSEGSSRLSVSEFEFLGGPLGTRNSTPWN